MINRGDGFQSRPHVFKRVPTIAETEVDKRRREERDKQKEVLSEITRVSADPGAAIGSSIAIIVNQESILLIVGSSLTLTEFDLYITKNINNQK